VFDPREDLPPPGSSPAFCVLGPNGELGLPNEVCESQGWITGTKLLLINAADGVLLTSTEQALAYLKKGNTKSVDEFLAEKHEWARLGE